MGFLVSIVGPSGVGKTTLARLLNAGGKFLLALEEHQERPFQALLQESNTYALANQIDYLLVRATQEHRLRQAERPALLDGGLDLDFHGFTRLFYARGMLHQEEFNLCRRFYDFCRTVLPPPELVIALQAPAEVISARLAQRSRINIARPEDSSQFSIFLEEWLASLPAGRLLRVDAASQDAKYSGVMPEILERINQILK